MSARRGVAAVAAALAGVLLAAGPAGAATGHHPAKRHPAKPKPAHTVWLYGSERAATTDPVNEPGLIACDGFVRAWLDERGLPSAWVSNANEAEADPTIPNHPDPLLGDIELWRDGQRRDVKQYDGSTYVTHTGGFGSGHWAVVIGLVPGTPWHWVAEYNAALPNAFDVAEVSSSHHYVTPTAVG